MRSKRRIFGTIALLGMMILTLDGKTALEGASEGLMLCIKTVIPSLFPFFVLSNALSLSCMGTQISLLRPLARICTIPKGLESILISAFLGGYPVGAQVIGDGYRNGQISRQDAQRLLGFCNNAGPSFLFGITAPMFAEPWAAWLLWLIHILSAVIVSLAISGSDGSHAALPIQKLSIPKSLETSIRSMASVCGWIILFRVLISFLEKWVLWLLPPEGQVAVIGLLELSNGCLNLSHITDASLRFVICSCMLALGGLCVTMQTISAANGLSLRFFFLGKAMQTAISLFLSMGVVCKNLVYWLIPLIFVLLYYTKTRKRSSILKHAGV